LSKMVRFGGPVEESCVSLRLFGETLDPEMVTQLLGCKPTEAHRKGDIIPDKRYHRVANNGSWRLHSTLPRSADLEEQVRALLSHVTSDLAIWQRLNGEFAVDLFCGVFLKDCNRGFSLSPAVMHLLSERCIEIGFDIYAPTGSA